MSALRPLFVRLLVLAVLLSSLYWPAFALAAATVTVTPVAMAGYRQQILVTIAETGNRDTSEVTISGVPLCGTIVAYRASRTAGTGTTIHPRLGLSASFTADGIDEILEATATAATINEVGSAPYCTTTGTLYLRSAPNSVATDHSITTRIVIVAGAQQ